MLHPRGLGPTPLRGVNGGQQRGPSEPPDGLRPCANPMNPPGRRIPSNQKQHQTLQITTLLNPFAIPKTTLQVQEKERLHDHPTRRTAAPHIPHLNRHALTHRLNCLPPTRGPANYPCEIRKLTIYSTNFGGSLMPVTRLLHPKRGDRTAGPDNPGKVGRGPRDPTLA